MWDTLHTVLTLRLSYCAHPTVIPLTVVYGSTRLPVRHGSAMARQSEAEIRDELNHLMEELIESLKRQTFLGFDESEFHRQEERIKRIRELSADFLAAMKERRAETLMSVHPPHNPKGEHESEKPNVTLPGKVEKIIEPPSPKEPEKAEISIDRADDLYKEIRIENTLSDENGNEVRLKKGADVDVTVEADKDATTPKKSA
jgi:hypothetical protein